MALAPFIAALSSRLGRWLSRSPEIASLSSGNLGRWGEKVAARHLGRNGYRVLYRNFRAPQGGEVDIVCRDKRAKTLVFIEVKTRRSTEFGDPGTAVNASKQRLISRGALAWLRLLNNPDITFRFDIVEVVFDGEKSRVNVIQNAFSMPEPYRY